ncbi:hypothetical protein CVT26_010889 [Gymnopilus dilepis]|uniref:Uncharacterized protein n=1 Tax=Gymnopilus dilepis TaxID=231916 RepID=A0A409VIW5_9AGAR|nr:hypothetical protein CVT26_010889 [Gymnopilus dilepis]
MRRALPLAPLNCLPFSAIESWSILSRLSDVSTSELGGRYPPGAPISLLLTFFGVHLAARTFRSLGYTDRRISHRFTINEVGGRYNGS